MTDIKSVDGFLSSTIYTKLDELTLVNYLEQYSDDVEQLIKLTPNKRRFYQQGMRAATLIRSISIASLSPPRSPIETIFSLGASLGRVKSIFRSALV